jgi:Pectate lyase superfamily protein
VGTALLPVASTDSKSAIAFGADNTGARDSTAALQAWLNSAGALYLPKGTYKKSGTLTLSSFTTITGDGVGASQIIDTGAASIGFSGTDVRNIAMSGFTLTGPGNGALGTGTGFGIQLLLSANQSNPYLDFRDLYIGSYGNDGMRLQNPIVANFENVTSVLHNRYGFNLFSNVGSSFTSCAFNACYANACTNLGYFFTLGSYVSLSGCACDACGGGYSLNGCQCVSLNGCGAEAINGVGYILNNGLGNSLNSCWTYHNNSVSISVTGTETCSSINNCVENSPQGGATNFITTTSGTDVAVNMPNGIKPNSYLGQFTLIDQAQTITLGGPGGAGPSFFGAANVAKLDVNVAGFGLAVKEGSNCKQGVATLVAGTVTVANTAVTATSRIFLTAQSPGGTAGFLTVSARTAGTSFTILSSNVADTSVVAYEIIEPG